MDAVSYPEKNVVAFINDYLTPLRINIIENTDSTYQTFWTPTLSILDYKGLEIQKTIGFFKPDELIATLHLGLAKLFIHEKQFETAEIHLKHILEEFSSTKIIPEAIFFKGVNLYKASNDPSFLKKIHTRLTDEYPENEWTAKAYPYQFLP